MTEHEFRLIINMMKAFPRYDPEKYTENTWRMYYQVLKDCDATEVQNKVMDAFKKGDFIPSPYQILGGEKKKDISWMKKYIREVPEKGELGYISRYAREHGISWELANEVLRNETL